MPPIDAATRDDLAYVRIHGRNTQGYLNGKTVAERFGWRYEDEELEEIGGRARALAESAGGRARHVQQQPRRRRPDGGAALPRAARPGAGRRGSAVAEGTTVPDVRRGELDAPDPGTREATKARGWLLARWRCAACAAPAHAADPERDSFQADEGAPAEVPADVSRARDDLKDELGDQGLLSVDDSTGGVRFLAKLNGFLTSAPSGDPVGATRDYLRDQADAFGVEPSDMGDLRLAGRESAGGIESLEFTQSVDGIPIVDSSLQAHLDGDGRLLAISGGLVPEPALDTTGARGVEGGGGRGRGRGVTTSDASYQAHLVAYTRR